jgi:hypothetical protein
VLTDTVAHRYHSHKWTFNEVVILIRTDKLTAGLRGVGVIGRWLKSRVVRRIES